MSEEERPLGFAMGIRPTFDVSGNFLRYRIQAQNFGLQKEAVITILKTLLRTYEDEYYRGFKAQ